MPLFVTLIFAAATASAAQTAPAAVDTLEKVKCVREQVTGSLVQTRKVCHTLREWNRIHNDAEAETRRIIQPGTTNDRNGG
jgi:hypothetical protein